MISEYHKEAETNVKFECIAALHKTLNDTFDQIEESLDTSLSKICSNFDSNKYSAILNAYNFLGKSQSVLDQLHMHFKASIQHTAFEHVYEYSQDFTQKDFRCLCQTISTDNFMFGLIDLCKSLLKILKSYFLIMKWHENYFQFGQNYQKRKQFDLSMEYIIQKLQNGIIKVCNDMENKIMIYLDVFNFSSLKFEELMQVLNVVNRYLSYYLAYNYFT